MTSVLSRFLGKPKKVKIKDGTEEVEIEIQPLRIADLPLVLALNDEDPGKKGKALAELITLTLKRSVVGATDDEIQQFGMSHLTQISDAIKEVNGLG